MSRTEERLADALLAKASTVRAGHLRPLRDPRRLRARPRMLAWLAPLGAAAAIGLIAVSAIYVAGLRHAPSPAPPVHQTKPGIPVTSLPRYYMQRGSTDLQVRSTATGKLIAAVPAPSGMETVTELGAAPDGRTFYVRGDLPLQTVIYSVQLNDRGVLSPLRIINGGVLGQPGETRPGLAVSPDGTRLALVIHSVPNYYDKSDTIVVIDLRTGAHRSWSGGLPRFVNGSALDITKLTWADNQTVDFAVTWCRDVGMHLYCGPGSGQVRALNVTSGGGDLAARSKLLIDLARFTTAVDLVADQQGHIIMELFNGQQGIVTVDQVAATNGSVLGVLYKQRVPDGSPFLAEFSSDPSGQHLLLFADTRHFGWIDHGVLRHVPGTSWDATPVVW